MKSIYIYVVVCVVFGYSELGNARDARDVIDLAVDTSKPGLPVANDELYNFHIKDYFGSIADYSTKLAELKAVMDKDSKRLSSQLKGNSLALFKSSYPQVIDGLTALLKEVDATYGPVTQGGMATIIETVNHIRKHEREFYSKVNVNIPKCRDLVDKNAFYKWEKPATICSDQAIITSMTIKLQYTHNINSFYTRFVDRFNSLAAIAEGEQQAYVDGYLTQAKEELQGYSKRLTKAIQGLGQGISTCTKKSTQDFEKFKKSINDQAAGCF